MGWECNYFILLDIYMLRVDRLNILRMGCNNSKGIIEGSVLVVNSG